MQIVKSLFFVLLTYGLLSCAPQKAAPTTSGLGKTSQCGEILVGVTTEKQELELAGATLKEFSLGRLDIRVTPEFQRIASEAAMNEDSKIKVACKAIEMAGVEGDSEMVAYFIQMQSFLSMNPSVDDRIKWRQAFPHPKAAPQRQSRPTHTGFGDSVEIELDPSLARSCKQPTVGLRRQPEYFVSIWYHFLRQLKAEKFPQDRDLKGSTPFPRTVELRVSLPDAAIPVSAAVGDCDSVRCSRRYPLLLPLLSGSVADSPVPV
jgi:hypothetical protein